MRRMAATIVTHRTLSDGAPDDQLLARTLAHYGIETHFAVWDEASIDWAAAPVTIVRSTWDFYRAPAQWFAWIHRVSNITTLINAPDVLLWSSDKRYLRDLDSCGVACIPTIVVEPAAVDSLAAIAGRRGWDDIVVKPTIAASAFGAKRFSEAEFSDAGQAHLVALLERGAALVQPYLSAVEIERERSLVFISGEFTHAYTKPAFSRVSDGTMRITKYTPNTHELRAAAFAIAVTPGSPVYARVDLVVSDTGPLLMELELVEPDLGLRLSDYAVRKLATAISAAC
jgi:glutathione synthase/RimK-type ligase-like ATP-grasp enzyme